MKSELLANNHDHEVVRNDHEVVSRTKKTRASQKAKRMPKKAGKRAAQEGEKRESSTHVFNPDTKRLVLRTGVIGMRILLAAAKKREKASFGDGAGFDFGAGAKKRQKVEKVEPEGWGIVPKTAPANEPVVHTGASLSFGDMSI